MSEVKNKPDNEPDPRQCAFMDCIKLAVGEKETALFEIIIDVALFQREMRNKFEKAKIWDE